MTALSVVLALLPASGLLGVGASATAAQAQSPPFGEDTAVLNRRTAVVEVVEQARPAVVSIDANIRDSRRDFWGRTLDQGVSGTGVVLYEDGYIVTNNHVIASGNRVADDIRVRFDEADDGNVYAGTVISRVPEEDLALIKIEGSQPFPTIPISESDPILGETVIAIGNAVRQTHTVSTGIISGLHRELDLPQHVPPLHFRGLIQTDAAINHGNSGGPLLDINGALLGINTAITGRAENIGFAIPSSRVQWVLSNHLLSLSKARSYLGMEVDETEYVVTSVSPGGPADRAEIEVGDRLIEIDGKPLTDNETYRLLRLSIFPHEESELTLERRGRSRRVVVLAWNPVEGIIHERMGLKVEPIVLGQSYRRLLQIQEVDPEGPAARIGLQPGDVIDAIRPRGSVARQVSGRQSLAVLIARLESGTPMEIEVWRDDDQDGRLERTNRVSELYSGTLVLR